MTETLRKIRHRQTVDTIARLSGLRDKAIRRLIVIQHRIDAERKRLTRLERALAAGIDQEVGKIVAKNARRPEPPPPATPEPDPGIPAFLQRGLAAQTAVDAVIAKQIVDEQAARKITKARVRIERMKAKQSGATRRMPLSGADALKAIRED